MKIGSEIYISHSANSCKLNMIIEMSNCPPKEKIICDIEKE